MSTPYDGKILVVNWQGKLTPGNRIADTAKLLKEKMPNVGGLMLKTSNGLSWQGHLQDEGFQAVTGVTRIRQWVQEFTARDLDIHVWGVPRAKNRNRNGLSPDLEKEAEKFIKAANINGVKSLLLDVEVGDNYWQGTPEEIAHMMKLIRDGVGQDKHIGLILDGRRNRDFTFWVDPWLEFVDSLHPMVYPILFGVSEQVSIDDHLNTAFSNLSGYLKPIIPMLQAFGEHSRRPTPAEITQQGKSAWLKGAAGLSFYRLGDDIWPGDNKPQMGEPEYQAIAAIPLKEAGEEPIIPEYTWQQVVNALSTVANRNGISNWQGLADGTEFWQLFIPERRQKPYTGPPLQFWPLDQQIKQEILELLNVDAQILVRLNLESRSEQEEEERDRAARLRQSRGSIIGIHGAPGAAAPPTEMWDTWLEYLQEMGIKWYKQCDNGDPNDTGPNSIFAWSVRLKEAGIEPIIRYLVSEQFPDPLPESHIQKMKKYAEKGIVWAEIGNEPNLDIEWRSEWHNRENNQRMHHNNPEVIRRIGDTWVKDAQRALQAGVKPAFYAFAPTDWRGGQNHLYSSVFFTQKVVAYLAQNKRAETLEIFKQGGWIAVHNATYEQPVNFSPWRPDNTIWDMTLRGYEVVLDAFKSHFSSDLDIDKLVVMSTEGGVFTPSSTSMEGHEKLPNEQAHAQKVVEMYRWLELNSPLQAMCPWCISVGGKIGHFNKQFEHDGWFEEVNGRLRERPVYEAVRQLRFDQQNELVQLETASDIIKLDLPYYSQYDDFAATHTADCGPTSLAMIINAERPLPEHITVDQLYDFIPAKKNKPGAFTNTSEMLTIAKESGLQPQTKVFPTRQTANTGLIELLEADTPVIILVNYAEWDDVAKNNFKGAHFAVVSGHNKQTGEFYVHDPLFQGTRREKGRFFVWRKDRLLNGWGGFDIQVNPNFWALIPDKKIARLE